MSELNNIKVNKEAKNCWDYWDCSLDARKKCNVYIYGSGNYCWMFESIYLKKHEQSPKLKYNYENCWECPWFKLLNPKFE